MLWRVSWALAQISCIIQVSQFWGPFQKMGQKRAKFGSISNNFNLRSRISPERMEISKIGKLMFGSDFSRVRRWKSGELWSTKNKVLDLHCETPKSTFFRTTIFSGCCRCQHGLKFLHALENDQGLLAHTPPGTGVQQFLEIKHLKICFKFSVLAAITTGPVGVTSRNFATWCAVRWVW